MQPLTTLQDVKILAFTQFLLGPAGVQYLADLGADVVKVEPPGRGAYERSWAGGDTFVNDVSTFFLMSHRNVRSLTLDLKHPDGQQAALRAAACWSTMAAPAGVGGSPARPVTAARPVIACSSRSWPGRLRYGLSDP